MCLLFLCGPCSSPCRNCWSYLVHPSFSLVGEWNLDPLDWSWPEEGICLHYVTKSELHPLVLTSSPLWHFFPGWGAPGIPPGGTMALTLLYWWHHCHLGGWGGWFRVTPLVADRRAMSQPPTAMSSPWTVLPVWTKSLWKHNIHISISFSVNSLCLSKAVLRNANYIALQMTRFWVILSLENMLQRGELWGPFVNVVGCETEETPWNDPARSPVSAVRSLSGEIRDKNKMRAEWDLVRICSWVSASKKATTNRVSSRTASTDHFR